MRKENEELFNVMYDSIDIFVQLKNKGVLFHKFERNTDKVIISLYLALVHNNHFIKRIMHINNYKYDIKLKKNKNDLTIDEYYAYFVKYFYKFLDLNNVTIYTTPSELMEILLNTGIVEDLNIKYNYDNESLKKQFKKRNKLNKVLSKTFNQSKIVSNLK